MMEKKRTYIAIDLKSFYASVECKERNTDRQKNVQWLICHALHGGIPELIAELPRNRSYDLQQEVEILKIPQQTEIYT